MNNYICYKCEEEYDAYQSDAMDNNSYCSEICEIEKLDEDLK